MAALAQEHCINANLLFNCRRPHLEQQQAPAQPPAEPATVLLPVKVEEPVAACGVEPGADAGCGTSTPVDFWRRCRRASVSRASRNSPS
jgi:transposase